MRMENKKDTDFGIFSITLQFFGLVFVMLAITERLFLLAWVPQWDAPRRRQTGPDGDGHDVVGDALLVVWTVHFTYRRKLSTWIVSSFCYQRERKLSNRDHCIRIYFNVHLKHLYSTESSWVVWALLAQYFIIYNVKDYCESDCCCFARQSSTAVHSSFLFPILNPEPVFVFSFLFCCPPPRIINKEIVDR